MHRPCYNGGMNMSARAIAFWSLATWPLAFLWAINNSHDPVARAVAGLWIPLVMVLMILVPGIWYEIRYIPRDIWNYVASRRPR